MSWITIYAQGFDSSFPSDWYISNGGGPSTWQVVSYSSKPLEPPGFGNGYAICDADGGGYPFNDTLFSPKIGIPSGFSNLKIEYFYAFKKYGFSDFGKVLIRYFNGASWSSWSELKTYSSTSSGKDSFTVPTYDSLQVAFVYFSLEWSFWFAVDEFRIMGGRTYSIDVAVEEAREPANRGIYFKGDFLYPRAVISNHGTNPAGFFGILRIYLGSFAVYVDSQPFTLPPDTTIEESFRMWVLDTVGYMRGVFRVRADGDSIPENDSLVVYFRVYPQPITDTVIPYSRISPTIDGIFNPSEWSDALVIDVSNFAGKGSSPVDTGNAKLFVKHDGSFIYLALRVSDSTYNMEDAFGFIINDNGDGFWEGGEGENVLYPSPSKWWATREIGRSWVYPRRDRFSNFGYSLGVYEVKIPFGNFEVIGDPSYIKTGSGKAFKISLYYKDGRNGRYLAWWPQNLDTSSYYSPSLKARLKLKRPTNWWNIGIAGFRFSECELGSPCYIKVFLYDDSSSISSPCTLRLRVLSYPSLNLVYSKDTTLTIPIGSADSLNFTFNPPYSGYFKVFAELSRDSSLGNNYFEGIVPVSRVFSAPFVENFEGEFFPPLGWKVEGTGWVRGNNFSSSEIAPPFGISGYGFAEFTSYTLLSGDSSALISPKIIAPSNPVLSFWWWNGYGALRGNFDYLLVYYRTQRSPWTLLSWLSGDVNTWRRVILPLPVLSGDTVQIRFVGVSDFGDTDISLDDVGIIRDPLNVSEALGEENYKEIYDVSGRLIFKGKGNVKLKRGVYFVKVGGRVVKLIVGDLSPL